MKYSESTLFAIYLLNKFKYIIFDFDNTLSHTHLATHLETDTWEQFVNYSGPKYLSNITLIKSLLKYKTNQIIFVFSHGDNEKGIRAVLDNELGKKYSRLIFILCGRSEKQTSSSFRPTNSLSKDSQFQYKLAKADMFKYIKEKCNIKMTKNNTVFFDDTKLNLDINCDKLNFCTRVDIIDKNNPLNKNLNAYVNQINKQINAL